MWLNVELFVAMEDVRMKDFHPPYPIVIEVLRYLHRLDFKLSLLQGAGYTLRRMREPGSS